jgi:hypothetical protein
MAIVKNADCMALLRRLLLYGLRTLLEAAGVELVAEPSGSEYACCL